jgi:hypothetical protein
MTVSAWLRVVSSLLLIAIFFQSCSRPQPNSPCTNPNSAIQISSPESLSRIFGQDAIQAAVDSIARHIAQQENISTPFLARMGTETAVNTALATGKHVNDQDKIAMDTFLREAIVPTIKQHPTCPFRLSALHKPDIGIQDVYLESNGDRQIAKVKIANIGQGRTYFVHVLLWNVIDGMNPLSGQTEMVLAPGQWRNVSNPRVTLPMSEMGSGKKKLALVIQISYANEAGGKPIVFQEEWGYDPSTQTFILSSMRYIATRRDRGITTSLMAHS